MGISASSMMTRYRNARPAAIQKSDQASVQAYSDALLTALFQAICDEIQQKAVVNVTNVAGVTAGTASSGPGTGTIS